MYTLNPKRNKALSVFTLVMINIIAIDSLRNLPSNAATGLQIIFYYLVAGVIFLLPCLLITAELATNRPKTGGAYIWVRDAFGAQFGFMTIWIQWIYNVIWYPTILSFIAANIAYLINPTLASNTLYMVSVIIVMFSLSTIVNCFGMRISGGLSNLSAIIGTIIPMLVIIALGILWMASGKPLAIQPSLNNFIPLHQGSGSIAFMVVILFSLMGFEMSAVHAGEVKNPKRDFPRALYISAGMVMFTMILASAAIAIVVPQHNLNIVSGLDQAFAMFLSAFHLKWMMPIVILMMILGGFGGMSAWVVGPTKGLMVAAQDGCAPAFFGKANRFQAPAAMLIAQWVIVIGLCLIFLLFKSFNTWYWMLSDLAAQLALIFYILVFAASIRLRYKTDYQPDTYRIPFGNVGIWIAGLTGIAACIMGIVVGLIPPTSLHITHIIWYEAMLIGGCIGLSLIPLLIYQSSRA